ncbi:MAG: asparagine synthase C-terminal domain-containing protein, partial [Planctomycetota bacterium]
SLLPTYWVSRAASDHVRVALTGDGGDELFLGYDRHRVLDRFGWLPETAAGLLAGTIPVGRNPKSPVSKLSRLHHALAGSGYKDLLAIFPHHFDEAVGLSSKPGHTWHYGMTQGFLAGLALRFDRCFYLPEDLLRKTDTASMSCGLEVRCPFLDTELSQLALRADPRLLMPRGKRKGLIKQVARKYLPDHIVDRPKRGFAIPIGDWFRSDYGGMRTLLHDHLESADPFPGLGEAGVELNMVFVKQMLREHDAAGEKSLNPWHGRDHSQRLYMLLVLSIWCRWLARIQKDTRPA